MNLAAAKSILSRNGFYAYFGPGYTTRHAIDSFMARYPRGKGIKGHRKNLQELYEACLAVKMETSRVRAWRPIES